MKILICGDYIVDSLSDKSEKIFGDFVEVIKESDIAIYNQEHPVTSTKEIYPTKKFGPTGRCDPASIKPIVEAGFNYVSLGNNHIFNRGIIGLRDTISNFKKYGIETFGAGENIESSRKILYVEKNEIKIAFLNYAENEFNSATKKHGGSSPLDLIDNINQIKEASENADFVFVIIHGGIEYSRVPSPRMVKQCRFYAEHGASAIVCHHTHVVSGYEVHRGTPIFYGIGNFIPVKHMDTIFNNEDSLTSFPVLFEIDELKKISFKGFPLKFNKDRFQLEDLQGDELQRFINKQNEVSNTLDNEILLKKRLLNDFLNTEKKSYYYTLFTRSNYTIFKIFRKLNLLSLYYKYINKKMVLNKRNSAMWNLHRCETHKDVLDIIYEEYIDTYSNK